METTDRKQTQMKIICTVKKCVWRKDDGERGLCGRFSIDCPYRRYFQRPDRI